MQRLLVRDIFAYHWHCVCERGNDEWEERKRGREEDEDRENKMEERIALPILDFCESEREKLRGGMKYQRKKMRGGEEKRDKT